MTHELKNYGVIDLLLGEYVSDETSSQRRGEINHKLQDMNVNTKQQLELHGYELIENQFVHRDQKAGE